MDYTLGYNTREVRLFSSTILESFDKPNDTVALALRKRCSAIIASRLIRDRNRLHGLGRGDYQTVALPYVCSEHTVYKLRKRFGKRQRST